MLKLHRAGASNREIAEALGVTHATIKAWLGDAGLEANGGHGPRLTRRRLRSRGTKAVSPEAAETKARLIMVANGTPPRDRSTAYEHKMARVAQISALADTVAHGVATGQSTPATLAAVMKLEQVSLRDLAALAPPPPPDPESDIKAAEIVRRKFALLVDAAEREARCKHCGRNPFGGD
jgi:hypothetical protein